MKKLKGIKVSIYPVSEKSKFVSTIRCRMEGSEKMGQVNI
jgi:hypothetical protein